MREPRAPLDLSLIPTLQLLAEGLYGGRSGFIPELVDHEPVDTAEVFSELARRCGDSQVRGINDWIVWYLEPGRLSDGDRQTLALFVKQKRESSTRWISVGRASIRARRRCRQSRRESLPRRAAEGNSSQFKCKTRDSSTLLTDPSASSSGEIRTESRSSALSSMSLRAT